MNMSVAKTQREAPSLLRLGKRAWTHKEIEYRSASDDDRGDQCLCRPLKYNINQRPTCNPQKHEWCDGIQRYFERTLHFGVPPPQYEQPLSLIHISEPTRQEASRMPSSA